MDPPLTAAAMAPSARARAKVPAELWEAPPLGLDGAEHVAAGSQPARRRFNARWLTATGLMGTAAAALMCGALFAAIERDSRHVARPILASRFASRRPVPDQPRGDRLQPHLASTARLELSHQLTVEQLAASGTHMRPFTHVTAKLAAVVAASADLPRPAPRAPTPPAEEPEEEPAPAPISASAVAKARVAGRLGAVERTAHASAVADEAMAAIGRALPRPPPSPAPAAGPPVAAALPPSLGGGLVATDLAPIPSAFAAPGFATTAASLPTGAMPPEILQGDSHAAAPPGSSAPPGPPSAAMFADDTAALGEPVNVSVLAKGPSRPTARQRMLVAKRGDTLDAILVAAGLPQPDAEGLAGALWRAAGHSPAAFAGGEEVMLTEPQDDTAPADRPPQVRLMRGGATLAALAATDAGDYVPVRLAPPPAPSRGGTSAGIDPARLDGVSVRDALYRLADAKVMEEGLVDALVRLAEHDVDLDAPLSAADSLDLVYGLPDADAGEDTRPAAFREEIAFLALNVEGKTRRYYRFTTPDDGAVDYYDEGGRSVTKLLLRKPFANGRQGDGFGWRVHPILGDRRFHNGVDFVGPAGSPIVAAGAGVVEKIDYQGGYGKYVRLRHDGGYETTYAHVAGFPAGLKVGQRVRQGQTIAYVGSTGLSTGPHLYYELKVNGHYADPTRIKLAGGRVLQGEVITAFQRERARMDALAAAAPASP